MIKSSDITKAIVESFVSDPKFAQFDIERSEFVNMDSQRCPWIGVYRGQLEYNPETLGDGPDYWTAVMSVRLIVQATDLESGEAAEDQLEEYVELVINKMVEDTTIRSTVDMINRIQISYSYIAEDEETIYFQAAIIEMTLEVSTS